MHTHLTDLRRFIRAMELSLEHGLELHVRFAAPGHADLGYCTTFPHCPLCKAQAADVEQWAQQYPTALRPCHVCGTSYSPAEMARSERMKLDDESTDLRQILGPQRFASFARSYLIAHGAPDDLAGRLVEAAETREAERRAKFEAQQRREKRNIRFVREKILTDLHPTYGPDDDGATYPKFDAAEFAQVLERCQQMRIGVTFMSHTSETSERNLFQNCKGNTAAAMKVFAKWRKSGCDELFGASFTVPDDLLGPES
jgi:hypothetical protein